MQLGDAIEEVAQDGAALRGMDDLGMELDAVAAEAVAHGRDRGVARVGQRTEPFRRLQDGVAMAHPHRQLPGQVAEESFRVVDLERGRAVLLTAPPLDSTTELLGEQLHPVADAEHRHPGPQRGRVAERGSRVVDAGWPTG